jgi:ornithine carrier protein
MLIDGAEPPVKVRLQSQHTDRPLAFKGPFDCFKQTYQHEGLKGLYRVSGRYQRGRLWLKIQGISMPILGAAAENATLFLVYNKFQDLILRLDPHPTSSRSTNPAAGSMLADEKHMSEKQKGKRRELRVGELATAAAGAGAAASFVLWVFP